MFYVRLNKVKILNNREMLGKAEVQFMSFVNAGESDFPMLKEFFEVQENAQRNKLIKEAISKVISARVMTPVHKIRDKQQLTFGDTGYIIHRSDIIPNDFNWMLIAIELDHRTRDNAALLETILTKQNISTVSAGISALAGLANPLPAAVLTLTELTANTIVNLFKNDKDDQIGLFMTSFIRQEHYPHGVRERQDVPDISGNMFIDYTLFGYE